jgi:hypothetical protein
MVPASGFSRERTAFPTAHAWGSPSISQFPSGALQFPSTTIWLHSHLKVINTLPMLNIKWQDRSFQLRSFLWKFIDAGQQPSDVVLECCLEANSHLLTEVVLGSQSQRHNLCTLTFVHYQLFLLPLPEIDIDREQWYSL